MHTTIHSEIARQQTEQRIASATRAKTTRSARSGLARFRRPE